MKKWAVLTVIALIAVLVVLQYLQRKTEISVPQTGTEIKTEAVQGIPLTEEIVSTGAAPADVFLPRRQEEPKKFETFASFVYQKQPACKAGTLKNIISSHGKFWGEMNKDEKEFKFTFTAEESGNIRQMLSDYQACEALASRKPALCNELPSNGKAFSNPRYFCIDKVNYVMFAAYMAGMVKNDSYCKEFLKSDRIKGADIPEYWFCKAAAHGLPSLCDKFEELPKQARDLSMKSFESKNKKKTCYKYFPRNEMDCAGSSWQDGCRDLLFTYKGIAGNNPTQCPGGYSEMCAAFLSKSNGQCQFLKEKLVDSYCYAYNKMKDSEEHDKRVTEEQKAVLEMNKRAREMRDKFNLPGGEEEAEENEKQE
ncbi:MAG: hypothetical protein HY746_01840 [Elusimicrobia bacterium]|nr:hypothetical protein [Elusimicrobiota bacterium]